MRNVTPVIDILFRVHLLEYASYTAVRYKDLLVDSYADLCGVFKSCGDVCGIIYCLERSACDALAAHLSSYGISCAGKSLVFPASIFSASLAILLVHDRFFPFSAYHAGLNNKVRSSVLDDWISSKIQVVVATVAFGYEILVIQLLPLPLICF